MDTMEEYNEIDETNPETQDAFAAYLAEGSQKDREVCHTASSNSNINVDGLVLKETHNKLKIVLSRWFSVESLVLQSRRSRTGSPWRVFGRSYHLNPTRRPFWNNTFCSSLHLMNKF